MVSDVALLPCRTQFINYFNVVLIILQFVRMRPSCILKKKMASRGSLGDSIVTPAILENADDEKEVKEINDSEIASFCDKYPT